MPIMIMAAAPPQKRQNGAPLTPTPRLCRQKTRGMVGVSGRAGAYGLGALRRAAVQKPNLGMLAVTLVERVPDQAMIVEVGPAGEGDLGSGGEQHLVLGAALGGEEVAAVDHCRSERTMV